MIPWYVTLVRLIVPISILRWPLFGIILSTLADMYDWKFINVQSHSDYLFYQNWDKAMDLYYWLFALFIVFRWKEKKAQLIALVLFFYRVTGMVFFWLTGDEKLLFLFPNVFENFFIFYVACLTFSKNQKFFLNPARIFLVLAVLFLPKLVHEYFMHVVQLQPWQVLDIAKDWGLTGIAQECVNNLIWGIIFYTAPVLVFLNFIKRTRKP